MKTPLQMRHENDIAGLTFISQFRWLRVKELGHLMRPNTSRNGYVQATQTVKSWVERELIILRKLPARAGSVCVLSSAGVRLLEAEGITARTGKDVGKETENGWIPGQRWKHDLLAHGVLVRFAALGYTIFTEHQIRKGVNLTKIPDGLAVRAHDVIVFEAERSAKAGSGWKKDDGTGKSRPRDGGALANFIASVAGKPEKILGFTPTRVGIIFDPEEKDTRGAAINHKLRVTALIKKEATRDVKVTWLAVQTENHGVISMQETHELLICNPAEALLNRLNKDKFYGWSVKETEEHGRVQWHSHGDFLIQIMLDESQVQDSHDPNFKGDWMFNVNGYWGGGRDENETKMLAVAYAVAASAAEKKARISKNNH